VKPSAKHPHSFPSQKTTHLFRHKTQKFAFLPFAHRKLAIAIAIAIAIAFAFAFAFAFPLRLHHHPRSRCPQLHPDRGIRKRCFLSPRQAFHP
jgi:hypothetical protein